MLKIIKETVSYISSRTEAKPEIGIILGTGLGGMVKEIEIETILEYEDIPNFPVSTVESHHGKLIFGTLGGKRIVAMQGRFHYYEGYSPQEITFPVRIMKYLGITHLFVSNASGGINPEQEIGDLMILDDHINLIPNPLIGRHEPEFGDRFPDMSETYDRGLLDRALEIGRENDFPVCQGCYVAVTSISGSSGAMRSACPPYPRSLLPTRWGSPVLPFPS